MSHSPFLKINGDPAEQEAALVSLNTTLHAPLYAGCCSCCPPIRLGRNQDKNICPVCGREMAMSRIPPWQEGLQLLFEAGYLVM
jgi:hypothetical protein